MRFAWGILLLICLYGISFAQDVSFTVACRVDAVLPKGKQLPDGGFLATVLKVTNWGEVTEENPLPREYQKIVVTEFPRLDKIANDDVLRIKLKPRSIVTAVTGERIRSYSFIRELAQDEI